MDDRRKRLMFRAHHMGSNENDLLFGGFAERSLANLTDEQVVRFETLIEVNDSDLFNWVTGKVAAPAEYETDVMVMMRSYVKNEAART